MTSSACGPLVTSMTSYSSSRMRRKDSRSPASSSTTRMVGRSGRAPSASGLQRHARGTLAPYPIRGIDAGTPRAGTIATCSRASFPQRSSASRRCWSASRSTSRPGCRPSRRSGCPTRPCARAGSACGRRSGTRASPSRPTASRSTSAPADFRKEGPSFDLPIALGILAATGCVATGAAAVAVVGELALDGNIQPVRGVLAVALACRRQRHPALARPRATTTPRPRRSTASPCSARRRCARRSRC